MERPFTKLVMMTLLSSASGVCSSAQASEAWTAVQRSNPPSVHVSKTATDGSTVLRGGCNKLLGAGFTGSFEGYRGDALRKADDKPEPVSFEITGKLGAEQFSGQIHYFAPDKTWVITGRLPPTFVGALGRGDMLAVRNGKGKVAFSFTLEGAAKVAETMQKGCDLATAATTGPNQGTQPARGTRGSTQAQFARECVKCFNEALKLGRSVATFCHSNCSKVYETMVCDRRGVNCRVGP